MAKDSPSPLLSAQDLSRYQRQMLIPGWGEAGQQKLKAAKVFIAGAGGLGSPASIYLAVAGVGEIIICDFDSPDLSNLNRQILHSDARIGINKAESAKMTLETLNPSIKVRALTARIEAENADELVGEADIIVDCMDNFPTRFVLNDCARRKGLPLVHGSVWGMEGRLTLIHSPETACLQCLVPEAPPKEIFPIVGATAGVIGCWQAMETLKYLTGVGSNLKGKQLVWNGADMSFNFYPIRKDPHCPVCGGQ
jgi:adenylyltransferase/sulfurtransferase